MKTFEVFYHSGHSDLFLADYIEYCYGALLLQRYTYDRNNNKINGWYTYMIFAPGTFAMAQEVEDEDPDGQEIQVDLEDRIVGQALSA